jgi:fructose-specific phosphotransferase system IIC component
MWILFFILACYGLTNILVYGSILSCVRPKQGLWGELFKCPMCMGFHVGWFVALMMKLSNLTNIDANIVDVFLLACLSSGSSYVLCSLFTDFGINFKINKEE